MKKIKLLIMMLLFLLAMLALAGCGSEVDEMADLRGEYFDFAADYRLDYLPEFELNMASHDSSEYLLWAFTINLDNWGEDKGTMSASYVEEMVEKHFKVTDLEHNSLFKCWDYADGVYTAIPSGVNPEPLAILQSLETETIDGVECYKITVDFCNSIEHGEYLEDKAYEAVKQDIVKGDYSDLEVYSTESFTFYFDDETPIFIEHQVL